MPSSSRAAAHTSTIDNRASNLLLPRYLAHTTSRRADTDANRPAIDERAGSGPILKQTQLGGMTHDDQTQSNQQKNAYIVEHTPNVLSQARLGWMHLVRN
ncbi:hypothetical protein C8F01DRAFT_1378125 [Mycena amicta]|nr:hypothetical protein C8F01DRAFT_1378125 [Mycena amicta]